MKKLMTVFVLLISFSTLAKTECKAFAQLDIGNNEVLMTLTEEGFEDNSIAFELDSNYTCLVHYLIILNEIGRADSNISISTDIGGDIVPIVYKYRVDSVNNPDAVGLIESIAKLSEAKLHISEDGETFSAVVNDRNL
jgi:hypothetical protein